MHKNDIEYFKSKLYIKDKIINKLSKIDENTLHEGNGITDNYMNIISYKNQKNQKNQKNEKIKELAKNISEKMKSIKNINNINEKITLRTNDKKINNTVQLLNDLYK